MGDTYTGRVVKTTDFGAFVELKKGTDGLLHVSNVGPGRVAHIEDVIARGDTLDVVVQEVDKERGASGSSSSRSTRTASSSRPRRSSSGRRTLRRASRGLRATIVAAAAATAAAATGSRSSGAARAAPESLSDSFRHQLVSREVRGDESEAIRLDDRLCAAVDAKLGEDVLDVRSDGLRARPVLPRCLTGRGPARAARGSPARAD